MAVGRALHRYPLARLGSEAAVVRDVHVEHARPADAGDRERDVGVVRVRGAVVEREARGWALAGRMTVEDGALVERREREQVAALLGPERGDAPRRERRRQGPRAEVYEGTVG